MFPFFFFHSKVPMPYNKRYWQNFNPRKITETDNPFWVKQALNVSRHSPADPMLRAGGAVIPFVGGQLVGLLQLGF